MAEVKKLRFMQPRGYHGVIIARGALIDVTEPWASRFIADGTAVEAEQQAAKTDAKPKSGKPAKSSKKK